MQGKNKSSLDTAITNVYDPSNTFKDIINIYSNWNDYEKDLAAAKYRGPVIVSSAVDAWVKNKEARILDLGAGTGHVAEELIKRGFSKFDALDPCEELLQISREKKLYGKYITEAVTSEKTSIDEDAYDVVVCSGAFGHGHVPCVGLKELVRITKPGGYVIFVMRKMFLENGEYKDRFRPFIQTLETMGYWKVAQELTVEKYVSEKYDGAVFVCEVQSKGFSNYEQVLP